LLGVPTHSGEIKYKSMLSLMNLVDKFRSAGIRYELQIIPGCPLVQLVRNFFANRVAVDLDQNGDNFTHLLMADADGANFENGVMELLKADKPVSAILFSMKDIKWPRVWHAARVGVPPEGLREFAALPDIGDPQQAFNVNELIPMRYVGTGVMLVKREVFCTLAEKNPGWKYLVHNGYVFGEPNPPRDFQYDFFQTGVDAETKNFWSEDFFFCDQVHKHGFGIFGFGRERTVHTGNYDYVLNLPAIASLGSVPVAMSEKNPTEGAA
jgi:hypothetical protein